MNALKNYKDKKQYGNRWQVKPVIYLAFLFSTFSLSAAEVSRSNPVSITIMTYVQVILGLIFVLGVFLLIAYLFKRISGDVYLNKDKTDDRMRVLDSMNINTRERILLVEVEKTPILLSSSAGKIETLHVFPERKVSITEKDEK